LKSLRLGKLLGITVELHWSFLLIAGLVVFSLALFQPSALIPFIVFFSLLFLTVFLHELAHSVVSIQRGIKVRKIMLLPIGGVALTERLPEKPLDEFLIAISGPAFNFAVAFILLIAVFLFPLPFPGESFMEILRSFISGSALFEQALLKYPLFALLWINLLLGSFNLFLPALPLDGGRVLRSILGAGLGYVKATSIVTKTSTVVAFLLFLSVFSLGILAPIIGLIILFGSREEERIVKMKHFFKDVSISQVLDRKPLIIERDFSLREALEEMLHWKKTAALVELKKGHAVLTAAQIIESQADLERPVESIAMEAEPIDLNAQASRLVELALSSRSELIPVTHKGKLSGAINVSELEKFFQLHRLEKML